MSYESTSIAWRWRVAMRHPACDLSAGARSALWALSCFMRKDGRAWPSVDTLARTAGYGRSTLFQYLDELEAKHYLLRQRRKGATTLYFAKLPYAVNEPPWTDHEPIPF